LRKQILGNLDSYSSLHHTEKALSLFGNMLFLQGDTFLRSFASFPSYCSVIQSRCASRGRKSSSACASRGNARCAPEKLGMRSHIAIVAACLPGSMIRSFPGSPLRMGLNCVPFAAAQPKRSKIEYAPMAYPSDATGKGGNQLLRPGIVACCAALTPLQKYTNRANGSSLARGTKPHTVCPTTANHLRAESPGCALPDKTSARWGSARPPAHAGNAWLTTGTSPVRHNHGGLKTLLKPVLRGSDAGQYVLQIFSPTRRQVLRQPQRVTQISQSGR
jgi:hypothetical protein